MLHVFYEENFPKQNSNHFRDLFKDLYGGYYIPVDGKYKHDSDYLHNKLKHYNKKPEQLFLDIASKIEKDIFGGCLYIETHLNKINKNAIVSINFHSKEYIKAIDDTPKFVKSLTNLVIYLKYEAKKGDIVKIYYPEHYLTPKNHVLIARYIALLSKYVTILLITHSDFVLRELELMIVLSNRKLKKYDYLREYSLKHEEVKASIYEDGKYVDVRVDVAGFQIDSIGDVITKQNMMGTELYCSSEDEE